MTIEYLMNKYKKYGIEYNYIEQSNSGKRILQIKM